MNIRKIFDSGKTWDRQNLLHFETDPVLDLDPKSINQFFNRRFRY